MFRSDESLRVGEVASRKLSQRKMSQLARLFLIGCAAVVGSATVPIAGADPLVCATVYYRVMGGSRQYVLNHQCYVSTPWPSVSGAGPDCTSVDSGTQVCWGVELSLP